jgi:hypothetical protein
MERGQYSWDLGWPSDHSNRLTNHGDTEDTEDTEKDYFSVRFVPPWFVILISHAFLF